MARQREIIANAKKKQRKIVTPLGMETQIDNYIQYCAEKNLKESTIDSYVFYLAYFKTYLRGKQHTLLVDDIKEKDIKDFLNNLREVRENAQATINSAISSIRPFFTYLVSEGRILINPMESIIKGKIDKKPIIPFTLEQLNKLLKQPDKSRYVGFRDFCIMLLLIDTGMRIQECLNIKINDVKFKDSRIVLDKTKNRTPRIVGINEITKAELKRFLGMCMKDCDRDEYLFQNQDGEQLKKRTIQENIKKYGQQAKIKDVRVSPHTFRHTFAINYIKNGGSTASLRAVLGHLTIETVEKYLYWSDSEIVEQNIKYSPVTCMNI